MPVVLLPPDQLIRFSKSNYSKQQIIQSWSDDEVLDSGLTREEFRGIDTIPVKSGDLLLLGVGGGREAIPLAKMGYRVTGLDFIDQMVAFAVSNAKMRGVKISGMVQHFDQLRLDDNTYDIAWISAGMYSSIPTRQKRIDMLCKLRDSLKSNGYIYCGFKIDLSKQFNKKSETLKKALAVLLFGNRQYETGDMIWAGFEFFHRFSDKIALYNEFNAAGLDVIYSDFSENRISGSAVLHKKTQNGETS